MKRFGDEWIIMKKKERGNEWRNVADDIFFFFFFFNQQVKKSNWVRVKKRRGVLFELDF